MVRQGIFTGFTPNDGLGDSLALGASKVNANFSDIYTTFGDGQTLVPMQGVLVLGQKQEHRNIHK